MHVLSVRLGRLYRIVVPDLGVQFLADRSRERGVIPPHAERPAVPFEQPLSVEVRLQAAVDFAVSAVVFGADGQTVEDHPRGVGLTLPSPDSAWVVLVCDFIMATVFLCELAVVEELLAEISR